MSFKNIPYPNSCDTFVALPPATKSGVIFGKNSDRPTNEVQEVIYVKAVDYSTGTKLQCTYIEIDQVEHTHAVILSKPSWLWGAEMGANEHGLCVGNEAVWNHLSSPENDIVERLLGMDLVRLCLERAKTAREGVDVLISLLEKYGQGGPCSDEPGCNDWAYHNSFLLADRTEAWVFETAAQHWAAERITEGVRNISNNLSIETKIDLMSSGLKELAIEKKFWDGKGEFNFAKSFASDPQVKQVKAVVNPALRYQSGKEMLQDLSSNGEFSVKSMFQVLRDEKSGICRTGENKSSATTGSQVSVLHPTKLNAHWFTATPNPQCSVFKPFIFTDKVAHVPETVSPNYGESDPVKVIPRFKTQVDRRHPLYKAHQKINPIPGDNVHQVINTLKHMEEEVVDDVMSMCEKGLDTENDLGNLYQDAVYAEMKFYSQC